MGVACNAELGPVSTPSLLLNHIPLLDDGRAAGLSHFGRDITLTPFSQVQQRIT